MLFIEDINLFPKIAEKIIKKEVKKMSKKRYRPDYFYNISIAFISNLESEETVGPMIEDEIMKSKINNLNNYKKELDSLFDFILENEKKIYNIMKIDSEDSVNFFVINLIKEFLSYIFRKTYGFYDL
uniref:Uncharacterized protein n=1 Tax=viral metagenome TaxID=1070528 RepID=A0A6C0AG66_9ZZZZ